METATTSKKGTWLVIGLLVLAATLVVISRVYRVPPRPDLRQTLQEEGFPAARRGMDLSRAGKKLLPAEEQAEMDAIYAEALQTLTPAEKQEFQVITNKGVAISDREIAVISELVQKALRSLSPERSTRLYALVEKAVQLQLAQQGAAPPPERAAE